MKPRIDLAGRRFGRLFVQAVAGHDKSGKIAWRCLCDCGKVVNVRTACLTSGQTQSCRCYMIDRTTQANTKHGLTKSTEFTIWTNMKMRCYNKNDAGYRNYGGRGIQVCDRWLESFANFFADMGSRPSLKHSIDRIDNNGNYEPSNCRWVTQTQQGRNRRTNRRITYNGTTKLLCEWEEDFGFKRGALKDKLRTKTMEQIFGSAGAVHE